MKKESLKNKAQEVVAKVRGNLKANPGRGKNLAISATAAVLTSVVLVKKAPLFLGMFVGGMVYSILEASRGRTIKVPFSTKL